MPSHLIQPYIGFHNNPICQNMDSHRFPNMHCNNNNDGLNTFHLRLVLTIYSSTSTGSIALTQSGASSISLAVTMIYVGLPSHSP